MWRSLLNFHPDSLVSSQIYEIIKTIYATTADATPNPISSDTADPTPRIKVLQSTLGQLRLNNIATLDALTTHFTRLIDLTSADEAYVSTLAQALAPCILRPRTESSLTMNERHAYRLVRDLFDHKEAIFGELKRQSASLGHLGGPVAALTNNHARARAVSSTDERDRRANMEARAKAISERTRDKSPIPANRHRRDKSTDGTVSTRFPVVASPTTNSHAGTRTSLDGTKNRYSLEVPGSQENNSTVSHTEALDKPLQPAPHAVADPSTNDNLTAVMPGAFMGGGPGPHIPPPGDSPTREPVDTVSSTIDVEKRDLFTKGNAGSGKVRRGGAIPNSAALSKRNSLGGVREGVTLSDKPMDD